MNQNIFVYFLHIPRTSGRATHTDLHNSGVNLSTFSFFDEYLSKSELEDNSLLCGHFGNHPIKKNEIERRFSEALFIFHNKTVKTFTLVRDPVSHTASMSIFAPEGMSRIEFAKTLIYDEPSNKFPFLANPQSSFIFSDISFSQIGEYELQRVSFSNNAQDVSSVVNFAKSNGIKIYPIENRQRFLLDVAECFNIYSVVTHDFPKETNEDVREFCMNNSEAIFQKHHIDNALHSLSMLG